jgi:hypothetical protein
MKMITEAVWDFPAAEPAPAEIAARRQPANFRKRRRNRLYAWRIVVAVGN